MRKAKKFRLCSPAPRFKYFLAKKQKEYKQVPPAIAPSRHFLPFYPAFDAL